MRNDGGFEPREDFQIYFQLVIAKHSNIRQAGNAINVAINRTVSRIGMDTDDQSVIAIRIFLGDGE